MDTNKRLKMHIRGDVKSAVYHLFHAYNAKKHGVKTHSIKYHNNNHVEVDVEGRKDALWAIVNKNRRGPVFCTVEELQIQFY